MSEQDSFNIVAIVLTTSSGKLILQQRDYGPLGAAHLRGKLGFFGGHGEPGEDPKAAIIREIHEELELSLEPTVIELVGVYRKQLGVHGDNNFVNVFRYLKPVDPDVFVVHEGKDYKLLDRQNKEDLELTPFAKQLVDYELGLSNELEDYRVKVK